MASSGENPRKRKDRLPKDRQDAHIGVDNEPGTPEAGTHEDEEQEEVFETEHQEVEEQLADEALNCFTYDLMNLPPVTTVIQTITVTFFQTMNDLI